MWATSYIEKLKNGETVSFRPRGNSMAPKINSGYLVTVSPLQAPPEKWNIVLCKVNGRQYLHLVTAVKGGQFQISNNHGYINGWTTIDNIYGRVIDVSR